MNATCCLFAILYHRGVYPADWFKTVHKYGGVPVVTLVDALHYVAKALPQTYGN
ncbi:uncharacterized protein BYT42DRAFT_612756 [Radiomyces spectabilis]|uniref:uncharacterized protein n=1 Tax=Radiomyces spectabilis TaxID=64574 RepID=UPI00221E771B|nr:uncharacterized protein BYT42DRAFT_612756 [Radiomyces spectabilis]KAI8380923.1 hypothetical protein BYT42DRAFT_612756 [Radiomyces spectabilis]